jgi:hypothetical protein
VSTGWKVFKTVRYLQVAHPAKRRVRKYAFGKARSHYRKSFRSV